MRAVRALPSFADARTAIGLPRWDVVSTRRRTSISMTAPCPTGLRVRRPALRAPHAVAATLTQGPRDADGREVTP